MCSLNPNILTKFLLYFSVVALIVQYGFLFLLHKYGLYLKRLYFVEYITISEFVESKSLLVVFAGLTLFLIKFKVTGYFPWWSTWFFVIMFLIFMFGVFSFYFRLENSTNYFTTTDKIVIPFAKDSSFSFENVFDI